MGGSCVRVKCQLDCLLWQNDERKNTFVGGNCGSHTKAAILVRRTRRMGFFWSVRVVCGAWTWSNRGVGGGSPVRLMVSACQYLRLCVFGYQERHFLIFSGHPAVRRAYGAYTQESLIGCRYCPYNINGASEKLLLYWEPELVLLIVPFTLASPIFFGIVSL